MLGGGWIGVAWGGELVAALENPVEEVIIEFTCYRAFKNHTYDY